MIPSVVLRKIISQIYTLNLNEYAWNKELVKDIFSIKFDDAKKTMTLEEVYKNGCNIGNCLLTSFIIQTKFKNLLVVSGKVEILKGTKNSVNGDHVWLEDDEYIYDPTLMIKLPKKFKPLSSYYCKDYTISSLPLSAELSYGDEFYLLKKNANYYYSNLFKVCC